MENPITIRQMLLTDIPFGMQLVQQAGWNQLEADWHRALTLHPEGCFLAEQASGIPAGTVTTCILDGRQSDDRHSRERHAGTIAWIAMVLVDTSMRNQGIGQKMMEHAVAHLDSLGIETQRLDATVFGKGLYEKLGFQEEYEVVRMKGISKMHERLDDEAMPWPSETSLPPILDLDFRITGTHRQAFLHSLLRSNTFYYSMFEDDLAYAGSRKGRNAVQLGPAVASTPEAGRQICDAMLHHFNGMPVFIDIPVPNKAALRWAKSNGLEEQRRFIRMYRGKKINDKPELIWASSGPEKG
ncbi:GNAT superfamily N-acetyltransferase [Dyadobacter sp. BE34]|uniref:GNAT superfamily N-acetyltransferase n=1 Tax=Dyadobacter fermentans TaxID=94254 RepID=A0ABU1QZL2_9BACT|nr:MULTISPECIES: GNAT family N-acetyltransferase [Dyadobacter]MDR6806599.1 GNAT superfamily N-acetyltransferase [Dyadobacter fermentans]MDR7044341.1 GNAT superfamily N-acetyltransferase [Dyadobacter sp. BE242]MDR7198651.1 GNAT superfamily N-acetyltransferase [Dyadobacter sp. BE34]MDR7216613.1 GNAT superfamily N-acetyltransferase [Dyadobacter sp. BE31]MDR7263861.1 GNAT superfamily N-acetyltransferase [Dyadobacter sp. BE32]